MIFQKKLIFLHICVMFCILFNKNIVKLTKAATVDNYYENFDNITQMTAYDRSISAVATAIDDFIQEYFIKHNEQFEFLIMEVITDEVRYIVDEVGRRNGGRYSVKVRRIFNQINYYIGESAIIFTADEDLNGGLNVYADLTNNFPKNFKFLHYCYGFTGGVSVNHQKSFSFGSMDQFQYFLIDISDKILLGTIEWWNENDCNFFSNNFFNTFNKSTMKWEKELKYVEKFTNFYGCSLTYSIHNNKPRYNRITGKYEGFMVEIFDIVAEVNNFTSNYVLVNNTLFDWALQNESVEYDFEVMLDTVRLIKSDLRPYHIGGIISNAYLKFVIPPGALYTSYEKVLLPFDEQTWWFLIATFGGAFGIIFMINLLPKQVKDIIYGEGVHVPAFNVVGTFFGIGQLKLPQNNFARIILMTFILFCLVIRTAYQGVQFDMMTKEMRRKPAVQSYQQILDEKYTVLVGNGSAVYGLLYYMEGEQNLKDLLKTFFILDLKETCFNPSDKQTFICFDEEIKNALDCPMQPVILDEVYLSLPVGVGTYRNHFILPALEKMFQLTTPFGIPQYHYKLYYETKIEPAVDDGPKVLFIEDLSFGFVIWLVACGVCLCVFFSELLTHFFMKKQTPVAENNLTDLIEVDFNHSQQTLMLNVFVENINEVEHNKNVIVEKTIAADNAQNGNRENHEDVVIEINENQNEIVEIQVINLQNSVEEIFGEKIYPNENENRTEIESKKNALIETKTLEVNTKSASSEVAAPTLSCSNQAEEVKIEANITKVMQESKEIDNEIDEIENLIQDFETEMEKPRKVLTDEEILEVALDYSDIELDI